MIKNPGRRPSRRPGFLVSTPIMYNIPTMIYDLIIIGGGPAGASAGVYSARKKLRSLLITYDFGGQSVVSEEIQNWIGTIAISGNDLAKSLEAHVRHYASDVLDIKTGVKVEKVEKTGETFTVTDSKGDKYESKTVLLTVGSNRKKLAVPGAVEFDQKGLTYCASCDGPLFAGQDVAVIGGGNAGFETAGQLLAYANSVTLLHHRDTFKADEVTVEKLLQNPKFKIIKNASTKEIKGEKFVSGLIYTDKITGEDHELPVTGIFVEIGFIPNTKMVDGLVALNAQGAIIADPRTQQTNIAGIWAAGDSTDCLYHQNNIAAGDAVKALEDIYNELNLK